MFNYPEVHEMKCVGDVLTCEHCGRKLQINRSQLVILIHGDDNARHYYSSKVKITDVKVKGGTR